MGPPIEHPARMLHARGAPGRRRPSSKRPETLDAPAPGAPELLRWVFILFFVSGFCSLVDEVVWLRLAMAAFGVTAPMVSIVLSLFMGGLALGSWGAGRLARRFGASGARVGLLLYSLAEIVIGLSAIAFPEGMHG